jgi:hypothetical protein
MYHGAALAEFSCGSRGTFWKVAHVTEREQCKPHLPEKCLDMAEQMKILDQ